LSNSKPTHPVLSWIRLRLRWVLGTIFNLAGVPGLVRECDYEAGALDARISVRVREMYTVIHINGFDVYFHRLTGKIDGVGSATGWPKDEVRLPANFPAIPDSEPSKPRT
jgi:hypothetical protein